MTAKRPMAGLALQLFAKRAADFGALHRALAPDSTLDRFFLASDGDEPSGRPMLARPLSLDRRIASFLLGATDPDPRMAHVVRLYAREEPDPLLVQDSLQERLVAVLRQGSRQGTTGIVLWGNPGAGKKLQLRHCARTLGLPLLVADLKAIAGDSARFGEQIGAIVREAVLQRANSFKDVKGGFACPHNVIYKKGRPVPTRSRISRSSDPMRPRRRRHSALQLSGR